jgi:hypothetical protein
MTLKQAKLLKKGDVLIVVKNRKRKIGCDIFKKGYVFKFYRLFFNGRLNSGEEMWLVRCEDNLLGIGCDCVELAPELGQLLHGMQKEDL